MHGHWAVTPFHTSASPQPSNTFKQTKNCHCRGGTAALLSSLVRCTSWLDETVPNAGDIRPFVFYRDAGAEWCVDELADRTTYSKLICRWAIRVVIYGRWGSILLLVLAMNASEQAKGLPISLSLMSCGSTVAWLCAPMICEEKGPTVTDFLGISLDYFKGAWELLQMVSTTLCTDPLYRGTSHTVKCFGIIFPLKVFLQ